MAIIYFNFWIIHGKNSFAEVSKNLARYRSRKNFETIKI